MKTYKQKELKEIIRKHELWLQNEDGGKRADLSYSDLSYSDLSHSDLSDSDLSYSNLRYSNMRGSDLSYSNMRGSNLRYSNLRYSSLRGSNLRGSDLSYSDLSYSDLHGVTLHDANLSRLTAGNNKEVKKLQLGKYLTVLWADKIAIGCQIHTAEEWRNFTNREILEMDGKGGLDWWKNWGDTILKVADQMPKPETKEE